jgi:hypothetical protein
MQLQRRTRNIFLFGRGDEITEMAQFHSISLYKSNLLRV